MPRGHARCFLTRVRRGCARPAAEGRLRNADERPVQRDDEKQDQRLDEGEDPPESHQVLRVEVADHQHVGHAQDRPGEDDHAVAKTGQVAQANDPDPGITPSAATLSRCLARRPKATAAVRAQVTSERIKV